MSQADMETNFVDREDWLNFLNSEYRQLYTRLARSNYPISLSSHSITATGALSYTLDDTVFPSGTPVAVVAMYKLETDNSLTKLDYYSYVNRRQHAATTTGDAYEFTIVPSFNYSDSCVDLLVTFNPCPTSGTYVLDYIPHPLELVYDDTDVDAGVSTEFVVLPLNWEERLVLGAIRRAFAKEETVNSAIEALIREVDENIDNSVQDWLFEQNNVVHRVQDRINSGYIFI